MAFRIMFANKDAIITSVQVQTMSPQLFFESCISRRSAAAVRSESKMMTTRKGNWHENESKPLRQGYSHPSANRAQGRADSANCDSINASATHAMQSSVLGSQWWGNSRSGFLRTNRQASTIIEMRVPIAMRNNYLNSIPIGKMNREVFFDRRDRTFISKFVASWRQVLMSPGQDAVRRRAAALDLSTAAPA